MSERSYSLMVDHNNITITTCIQDTPDTYHVLYEHVDETMVPSVRLSAAGEENQIYKFPLAGQPNAVSSLKIVKFTIDTEV